MSKQTTTNRGGAVELKVIGAPGVFEARKLFLNATDVASELEWRMGVSHTRPMSRHYNRSYYSTTSTSAFVTPFEISTDYQFLPTCKLFNTVK